MIKVEHLTKYYGDFPAVKDLSFTIEDGHVYGFLGPNGAGKSTTMNIMTGCLSPTEGTVNIGGFDILEEPEKAKRLIGYLPEQPPVYPSETPEEYLRFVGEAKGMRGKELSEDIEQAIESAGIGGVRDRLIGTLSKGYRQRVGIAQALLGHPEVIILDEPTVGLDPIQIIEIRDLIKELGKTHTVILSSHILSEVQAVCEQVLIISKGRLVAFDTPENLERLLLSSGGITLCAECDVKRADALLQNAEGIFNVEISEENGACRVKADLSEGADARRVAGALTMAFSKAGCPVFEVHAKRANLEDVFLELTESGSAEEAEALLAGTAQHAEKSEASEANSGETASDAESPVENSKESEENGQ